MNWFNEMLENDPDPLESREWIESLKAVIDHDGPQRAHQLLEGMVELTRRAGAHMPFTPTTAYINTIPAHLEPQVPGDAHIEWRIRSIIRWNALAMKVWSAARRTCLEESSRLSRLLKCRPNSRGPSPPVACAHS